MTAPTDEKIRIYEKINQNDLKGKYDFSEDAIREAIDLAYAEGEKNEREKHKNCVHTPLKESEWAWQEEQDGTA